jgi:hypothetical protein
MAFIAVLIGAVLIVAAFNGTHQTLAKQLEADIPGYFKWGLAVVAVLALGYVPGLRTPSRWLIGLVVLVVVLTNYQNIIDGIKQFAGTGQQTAQQAGQSEQQLATTMQAQASAAELAMAQEGSTTSNQSNNPFAQVATNALTDPANMAAMVGMLA